MRVVVGLGNPGSAYAATRHNIGFTVVEELARRWRLVLGLTRGGLRMAQGEIAGEHVMLVEPHMYMNLSGAVLARLQPPVTAPELIVIHDDLDLQPGCVRVKRGGGTAGHRGLDSLVEECGRDFARVRVGVGRPPHGQEAAEYVLSPFDPEEHDVAHAAVQRAADAVECILREGEAAAMNRWNVRTPRDAATAVAPMGRK